MRCVRKTLNFEIRKFRIEIYTERLRTAYIIIYRIARKFGGELNLAVLGKTAKLKSAKIYTVCMYVW